MTTSSMRRLRSAERRRGFNDRAITWPEDRRSDTDRRHDESLFVGFRTLRKFRVMIDASLMNDLSDYPTPATLLADVLRQPQFEVWRFSDEGPPSEITEWTDWGPRCPGWAILGDETLDRRRLLFYAGDSGGNTMTSINESGLDFARSDISVNAYESMRAEDAAAQRQRDYRAYRVAESLGVDLFATEREYLLARSPHNAPRVDAFSAHETLPWPRSTCDGRTYTSLIRGISGRNSKSTGACSS